MPSSSTKRSSAHRRPSRKKTRGGGQRRMARGACIALLGKTRSTHTAQRHVSSHRCATRQPRALCASHHEHHYARKYDTPEVRHASQVKSARHRERCMAVALSGSGRERLLSTESGGADGCGASCLCGTRQHTHTPTTVVSCNRAPVTSEHSHV
jgi:hypothetical protein